MTLEGHCWTSEELALLGILPVFQVAAWTGRSCCSTADFIAEQAAAADAGDITVLLAQRQLNPPPAPQSYTFADKRAA